MRIRTLTITSALATFLAGCPKPPPPAPYPVVQEEKKFVTHVVSSRGETLAKVAQWYTGSSASWKKIAEANADLKQRSLQLGDIILIPGELAATTDPMPKIQQKQRRPKRVEEANLAPVTPPNSDSGIVEPSGLQNSEPAPEVPQSNGDIQQPDTAVAPENPGDVTAPSEPSVEPPAPAPDVSASTVEPSEPPSSNVSESSASALGSQGKSMEQLIEEEKAEVERLKKELGQDGTTASQ